MPEGGSTLGKLRVMDAIGVPEAEGREERRSKLSVLRVPRKVSRIWS